MKDILIATRNPGKLAEFRGLLEGLPFKVVSLGDTSADALEVEETADTFEGNATLKARAYGERSGLLALADDSGIVVDALNGRPGVLSARYVSGSDTDRNMKLLSEVKNVDEGKRTARYVASLCVFDPSTFEVQCVEGVCDGRIVEPRGANGPHGYNPLHKKIPLTV